LLGNDSDPEGGTLTAKPETKTTTHGQVVISSNGTYIYTPAADYNGTDTFTYEACDNFSSPGCTQTTVTLTISAVNDAPRAQDDMVSTSEENTVGFDILANDIDIDDAINPASVNIVNAPAHGDATIDPITGYLTYTPDPDYAGNDSFTYTVNDVTGATSSAANVAISISPVNDAPEAVGDLATTRQIPVAISVLNNDKDIDDSLNPSWITIISNPSNGTVTINNTTGAITYIPNPGFLGDDTFSYQLRDAFGLTSNVVDVSVSVTPADKPPVAVVDGPITFSILRPITIDVMANDSDPDNAREELTIVSFTNPTNGNVVIENGMLVYTPTEMSESQSMQLTYTIQDPEGLTAEATVMLDFTYQPLHVSQGFSPNGDGSNDYWYIRSIENFPNNQLKVFNRWGLLVYTGKNYDNKTVFWDGRANAGNESSNLVDQGTYYYTLDLGDSGSTLSGYVVIVK
jgi:gliding motility-associated-like protein